MQQIVILGGGAAGMAAALAGLQSAIGPEVVLAAGCALLAAAVATARRATIARLESA